MASNFASLVFYVLGIIAVSKYGTSVTAFSFVAVSVPLFWVGAFVAWKKQYDGRLQAEKKGANRPSLSPRSYKKREHQGFGLTITNSEYDAYDVYIPAAPIGDTGYVLQFEGIFAQVLHKEKAFFETWVVKKGLPGRDGSHLFALMFELDIEAIYFGIISKDTAPIPNWHKDNCAITRDAKKHRTGLVLKHINQEVIPEPLE